MAESLNQKNPNRVIALLEERLSTPFGGAKSEILEAKIRSVFPLNSDKISKRATDPNYPSITAEELEGLLNDPKNQALLKSPQLLGNIQLSNRIVTSVNDFNLLGISRFHDPHVSTKAIDNYREFRDQVEKNTALHNSQQKK